MFLRNKKSKTTVKVCRETQPVPSLARSSGLPCQWPYSLCFSVDLIATKTLPPGAIGPGHELKLCEERE
jgi:hypothetical protein